MSDQDQAHEKRSYTVSVIGLGDMGSALAKAFLAKDHSVTVWNRTAEKGAPLVEAGARQAKSVVEAIEASKVTVVCVLDYEVSTSLLGAPTVEEKLSGKTLVQLTTGTPKQAREMEAWTTRHGIAYLDGSIMSYPSGIGTPECTILYAGPQTVFEVHKELLGSLAGNSTYLGARIGNASALDLSLLTFVFGAELGFLHGAALCESEGFSIQSYLETAAALVPILVADTEKASGMILQHSYAGNEASLEICASAFSRVLRFSDEARVDPAHIESLLSLTKRTIAAGYSDDEFPSLFEVLRKKNTSGTA
jgi:3-hydroxyisobutyrate dehydrogenase-like beta-hydroxyacid dehydrogenase